MLSFLLVLSVNQLSFIDKSNLLNYFQCHCVSEISADKNRTAGGGNCLSTSEPREGGGVHWYCDTVLYAQM